MGAREAVERIKRHVDYTPDAGEHIVTTARRLVKLAHEQNRVVTTRFNEIVLSAAPGNSSDEIVARFHEEDVRSAQMEQRTDNASLRSEVAALREELPKWADALGLALATLDDDADYPATVEAAGKALDEMRAAAVRKLTTPPPPSSASARET